MNLFVSPYYDDWADNRDGMRDWYSDNKSIKRVEKAKNGCEGVLVYDFRVQMNKKQKYLLKRRRKMRFKP